MADDTGRDEPGSTTREPGSGAAPASIGRRESPSSHVTDHLANERTFLAWVRSAIAIMALGFVVSRFGLFLRELALGNGGRSPRSTHSGIIGGALVALGVVMVIAALLRYLRNQRLIEAGVYTPSHGLDVALAMLVALGGAAMLIVLVVGA